MRFLRIICGLTLMAATAVSGQLTDHLKLHVDFGAGAEPLVAQDGAKLIKAENLEMVEGRNGGKAIRVSDKVENLMTLEYATGEILSGDEWTIAMWLKINSTAGRRGYLFRTYSTGEWGRGDMFAVFTEWQQLSFSRFDGNKKACTCQISAAGIPVGEWVHIAWVGSGGKAKMFINGYETNYQRNADVDTPPPVQRGIRLGTSSKSRNEYLRDAAIDELMILNKALEQREIKSLMTYKPGQSVALDPELYFPFDGNVEPANAAAQVAFNSNRVVFLPGVINQGAAFMRYGYDAYSSMGVRNIPGIAGAEMDLNFFFIPNWNGAESATHGLLHARSDSTSWLLLVKDKQLEFNVECNGKSQKLSTGLERFKKGVPIHISAAYSTKTGKMYIRLDGNTVAEQNFTLSPAGGSSSLIIGDFEGTDMYRASQAEGVIDELRFFPVLLNESQLAEEIARRDNLKQQQGEIALAPLSSRPVSAQEQKLWNLKGAYSEKTASRESICLNALWRFQLCGQGEKPQVSKWHYLAVPGRYSGHENGRSDHQFLIRNPDLTLAPKAQTWNGKPAHNFQNSWFERAFKADPAWKSQQIVLRFDRITDSAVGKLYFNGKFIADLSNAEFYEIPLDPELIKFGEDNFLLIHLLGSGNRWTWRGVMGDAWLDLMPDYQIKHPEIITSVENSKITVKADVRNSSSQVRKLIMEVELSGKNAPAVFRSNTIIVPPGGIVPLEAVSAWDKPELWDFENPYLYNCKLRLVDESGKELDSHPEVRFGFREFLISGADYVLNGNKVHLRNSDIWVRSSSDYEECLDIVRQFKALGYNSIRAEFNDKDFYLPNILRACDEEGLLMLMNVFGVSRGEYVSWSNPDTRAQLERRMASRIISYRNHPSIVMWYMSINFLGYGWDYHPLKMADGYLPDFRKDQHRAALDGAGVLCKYDSSNRPYFLQAGGNFGPVINSNAYFCWWPQAEKNIWVREWSRNPQKPLHIIETSFPYMKSFFGMDLRYSAVKPLFAIENAARYFGEDSYVNVEDSLAKMTAAYRTGNTNSNTWDFLLKFADIDLIGRLKGLILQETVLNWRADGISGICPFAEILAAFQRTSPHKDDYHSAFEKRITPGDFRFPGWHRDFHKVGYQIDVDWTKPLPFLDYLKKALSPTTVFFRGGAPEPGSKAAKYFAGKDIEQTLVAINDTLKAQEFSLSWRMLDADGKIIARDDFQRKLAPAEIAVIPVKFRAPEVSAKSKYTLHAEVQSPRNITVEPLEVRVFPQAKTVVSGKIALWDAKGISTECLRNLNVKFDQAQKLSSLSGYSLLIVGRESFNADFGTWAKKAGLKAWLENGHGNVLMLEQQPEALEMIGLETNAIYARDVFKPVDNIQVIAGLDNFDFSNWQGIGTMAPHRQPPCPTAGEESVPSPLWHWSNMDVVSSYPIRRPSSGSFRNLLVCGKDLAYSPLLELNCGSGRLVLCQMEVSGRSRIEPAAAELLSRLITHYSIAPDKKEQKQAFIAAPDKDFIFKALGFNMTPMSKLTNDKTDVIIASRNLTKKEMQQLDASVKSGATAIIAVPDPKLLAELNLKTSPRKIHDFKVLERGRKYLGNLSPRDCFMRYPLDVHVVSGKNVLPLTEPAFAVELPHGKGRYIFMLADYMPQHKHFSEASANWDSSNLWAESIMRERYAGLWTNLLSNLGVASESLGGRLENPARPLLFYDLTGAWDFRIDSDDLGLKQNWHSPASFKDTRNWGKLNVPGYWESQGITQISPNMAGIRNAKAYDGYAWYRKSVVISPELAGKDLQFHVGAIDDFDQVYVNGVEIGRTGKETEGYWAAPRNYPIPASLIKADRRLDIAIRVFDEGGNGGVTGKVQLEERQEVPAFSSFPYYTRPLPAYDTESAIRW